MPRPGPTSSAIALPLDHVLGTIGAVRVLRVLSSSNVPLSQAELARRSGLHPRGIPSVLDGLERAGVVDFVGRGRTRQVRLRRAHPLANPLSTLFQAEASRWPGTQEQLRDMVASAKDRVVAAWIEGPAASGSDRFNDPVVVAVLTDKALDRTTREDWRRRANSIQAARHVTIDLRFLERADLERLTAGQRQALENILLLRGPSPLDLYGVAESRPKKHQATRAVDPTPETTGNRSQRIAEVIAGKLLREPEMVERAQAFIRRRLPLASDAERLTLIEWQGLLDSLTIGQVSALLREESQRADRLRQSLPFIGELTANERQSIFKLPRANATGARRETTR